jgi:DNA-binding Lrp family transcriptional regulator
MWDNCIAVKYNYSLHIKENRKFREMSQIKFDAIDLHILRTLQANGRITNVELAEMVGLTAPPCLRRVRGLEDAGIIRGYHADLDASALGYSITVFAMVSLKSQAEDDLKAFENHVGKLPEVRECYMLNGEIDFIIKVVAADLQSFQHFLTSQLTSAPNVSSVKTSLTIRTAKQDSGIPL